MNGYWVVHLKVDATITELDFNKKCHYLDRQKDSWKFQESDKRGTTLAIIPRENILYVEFK